LHADNRSGINLKKEEKMTEKQKRDYTNMYNTLVRIKSYDSPAKLRKQSRGDWGLDFEDAIEMSYENIQLEAKHGIKGVYTPSQIK